MKLHKLLLMFVNRVSNPNIIYILVLKTICSYKNTQILCHFSIKCKFRELFFPPTLNYLSLKLYILSALYMEWWNVYISKVLLTAYF